MCTKIQNYLTMINKDGREANELNSDNELGPNVRIIRVNGGVSYFINVYDPKRGTDTLGEIIQSERAEAKREVLERLKQYSKECAMLRVEPSTKRLKDLIDQLAAELADPQEGGGK